MRVFRRAGLDLAVDEAGEGPLLVLQHGLGGDAAQAAEAAPRGVRRVTLECRGHGASPPSDDYAIATFADDVAALIATLPEAPVLGGISMGAALALRLAATRPGIARALVLIRPAWAFSPAPENLAGIREVAGLLARLPPAEARAAFEASPTAARLGRVAPDNLASLRGFFDRPDQAGTARLLAAIASDGPGVTEGQARAIRRPTLVLGCAQDEIHPLPMAAAVAAAIPGARLVALPPKSSARAAHFDALRAAIARFIEDLP